MKIKICPECKGKDENCSWCEGCGQVVIFNKKEQAEIDEHFAGGGATCGQLTEEQSRRFIDRALRAGTR